MAEAKARGVRFGRERAIPAEVTEQILAERADGATYAAIAAGLDADTIPTPGVARTGTPRPSAASVTPSGRRWPDDSHRQGLRRSPRKPAEVRWSAYRSASERVHRRQRLRTEREAKAKKREIGQAVADATLPNEAGRREEFTALAERWFRAVSVDSKPSTLRGYRAILDASVLTAWAPRRVGSITTAVVRDWMLGLFESGKAAPTVVHHLGTLRWILALAVEERTITINPASGVRLPKDRRVTKIEPRFLTTEEVARLAAHLDETAWPYGLLVTFAAYTGLRAGELAGLNVGNIDPLRGVLHVRRA